MSPSLPLYTIDQNIPPKTDQDQGTCVHPNINYSTPNSKTIPTETSKCWWYQLNMCKESSGM